VVNPGDTVRVVRVARVVRGELAGHDVRLNHSGDRGQWQIELWIANQRVKAWVNGTDLESVSNTKDVRKGFGDHVHGSPRSEGCRWWQVMMPTFSSLVGEDFPAASSQEDGSDCLWTDAAKGCRVLWWPMCSFAPLGPVVEGCLAAHGRRDLLRHHLIGVVNDHGPPDEIMQALTFWT
jgi:hypothetical protein